MKSVRIHVRVDVKSDCVYIHCCKTCTFDKAKRNETHNECFLDFHVRIVPFVVKWTSTLKHLNKFIRS